MYSTSISTFNIIYIGRPTKAKGLGDLLKALMLLKQYNWKLSIVGEIFPLDAKLIQSIKEKERIICFGPVHNSKICGLLNQHHIIIVPSHYENFGHVILEGMACGKAILASKTGGLKDIIKDEKNGIHFKPKNHLDLSEKIKFLFDNQHLITTLGNNSLEEVKKYSWERVIKTTIELFKKYI